MIRKKLRNIRQIMIIIIITGSVWLEVTVLPFLRRSPTSYKRQVSCYLQVPLQVSVILEDKHKIKLLFPSVYAVQLAYKK